MCVILKVWVFDGCGEGKVGVYFVCHIVVEAIGDRKDWYLRVGCVKCKEMGMEHTPFKAALAAL